MSYDRSFSLKLQRKVQSADECLSFLVESCLQTLDSLKSHLWNLWPINHRSKLLSQSNNMKEIYFTKCDFDLIYLCLSLRTTFLIWVWISNAGNQKFEIYLDLLVDVVLCESFWHTVSPRFFLFTFRMYCVRFAFWQNVIVSEAKHMAPAVNAISLIS